MYVGMRPEFWAAFQEKYNVKRIVEFYAATEGNAFIVNCFDKVDMCSVLFVFLNVCACNVSLYFNTYIYSFNIYF